MDEMAAFEAMAGAMVERGLATPDQVAADRVAMAAQLAQDPNAGFASAVNAGQSSATVAPAPAGQPGAAQPADVDPIDAMVYQGASSPQEYRFPPPPAGVEQSPEQELAMRTFLHGEQIPASIGNQIGKLFNEAAAAPPTLAQLEQSRQACSVQLHKMWGEDTAHHLAVAQAEVQRMAKTNPTIVEMLEASGLGNSPWLASTIYCLAKARGRG